MATTKGPKRVRPRPRPSTAAPLSSPGAAAVVVAAGGATLRGPGDDGLLWLSLARSLGRWSCCRRFSMSWWRRPTLWLSCCRRFSMSWCRRTTHSGCWPTPMLIRAALRCPALLCSATARHDRPQPSSRPGPPTLQLAPSRAERAKRDGGLRRASGAVLRRASCAEQTDLGPADRPWRHRACCRRPPGAWASLPGPHHGGCRIALARLPACLSAARHCPAWSRPPCCSSISNRHGHRRASRPDP